MTRHIVEKRRKIRELLDKLSDDSVPMKLEMKAWISDAITDIEMLSQAAGMAKALESLRDYDIVIGDDE